MSDVEKWSSASIVISSESMTAQDITALLRIDPTNFHKKGDLVSKRNPKSRKREDHIWRLDSNLSKTETLEKHIKILINIIENRQKGFEEVAKSSKCELFCGFSSSNGQGGFVLEKDVIARIGKLGLDLVLDLYPPEK